MIPDLLAHASNHHGVLTHADASRFGVGKSQLSRAVSRGLVRPVSPGVYVAVGAAPSWRQDLLAAVWSVPGALASHRAAAVLWGLDGARVGPPELVTPRWSRRPRGGSVIVHETKDLRGVDMAEVDSIPVTSLVRTLIDLPAVVHEFRAGQALDHAVRRDRGLLQLVTHRHLELARRGRNGTVAMRQLLEERGLGEQVVDSGFERRTLRLLRDAGLPTPRTQHKVVDGTFVCFIDLAWPDQLVALECDSLAHHFGERAHQWDRTRRRVLVRLGWTLLEFTYEDVTRRGAMVVQEARHHLGL